MKTSLNRAAAILLIARLLLLKPKPFFIMQDKLITINDGEKLLYSRNWCLQLLTMDELLLLKQKIYDSIIFAEQNDINKVNADLIESYHLQCEERHREGMVKKNKGLKKGFVYVMEDVATGKIKIGFSNNPKYRETTLQAEKPDIRLLFQKEGTYKTERHLHLKFSDKRVRGEWFDLDPKTVIDYMKSNSL